MDALPDSPSARQLITSGSARARQVVPGTSRSLAALGAPAPLRTGELRILNLPAVAIAAAHPAVRTGRQARLGNLLGTGGGFRAVRPPQGAGEPTCQPQRSRIEPQQKQLQEQERQKD